MVVNKQIVCFNLFVQLYPIQFQKLSNDRDFKALRVKHHGYNFQDPGIVKIF